VTQAAAEVTGDTADVTADVTQAAAGEPGGEAAGTEVAAWAWREDTSKIARIPAAKIAACIAR
jgi:hypothetical protein